MSEQPSEWHYVMKFLFVGHHNLCFVRIKSSGQKSFIDDDNIKVAKTSEHLNKREDLSVLESEYEMEASKRETNSNAKTLKINATQDEDRH